MPDKSLDTPGKPRFPWLASSLVLIVLLLVVGVSVYVVRSAPAPFPTASQAPRASTAPATSEAAKSGDQPSSATMSAFGSAAPAAAPPVTRPAPVAGNGPNLGIPKNSCQGFAEIAVRFWDLKKAGQPLQFVLNAIDQNSAGDAQKIRILKALAQVVYQNAGATRDQTYGNALEACANSPS